ncbi:acetamidase/formamidase family protein [Mesobacillus jeotgali]|uniref:acetamidase/formamidase family protein n=1 Tax=Mesobacillus jeotgali TaxID=129985 RepID=UPI00177FBC3C|nr:acetamidase/formamidase family protein [Mesobacillus jeotgali]UYZ21718.1 acetamidase/formamidase family protein [Mesobacillus jeotgali]
MVHTIAKEQYFYAFSKENKSALKVPSGSQVVIETYDCFQNQIQSNDAAFNSIDWNQINPATGSIYVEGAQPGDILKVKIDNIELGNQGVMATGPGLGVMGHRIDEFTVKVIPIENGKAVFNEKLQLPLNPMIGVIGVAPEADPVSCGTPGAHGGNMDTTSVTTGATLYFPVFQEGALFGLGDLHAAMGDGEIGVSGIEIPGKVTVTLEVVKGKSIPYPFLENEEGMAVLVSKETLDEAAKAAVEIFIDTLQPHTDLSLAELTMLMSAVGQVQVSQIVDPLLTARFLVPRHVLDAYQVKLF